MEQETDNKGPWEVNGAPGGYLFGFDMEEFENVEDTPPEPPEDNPE